MDPFDAFTIALKNEWIRAVERIHRKYQVAMALTEIVGGRGDNVGPSLAAESPGAPTLRGLGTTTHSRELHTRSNMPMGRWSGDFLFMYSYYFLLIFYFY
jgi:hypothetical protein